MAAASMEGRNSASMRRLSCADGSRPRILLAEDSLAARFLMSALLQRMGCDVDAVEHGEDAVSHAETKRYDVILLDIEMPVMDGVAAARHIRALSGPAAATPLMAFSAFLADSAKSGAWRESFDLALAKPAGRKELHEALSSILIRDAATADARARTPVATVAPESLPVSDPQGLTTLAAGFQGSDIGRLLSCAFGEMRTAAGDLAGALDAADFPAAGCAAHKLKGLALSFSAPRLAALCAAFEDEAARKRTGSVRLAQQIAVSVEGLRRHYAAFAPALAETEGGT